MANTKTILRLIACSAAAALLLFAGCSEEPVDKAPAAAARVSTITTQAETIAVENVHVGRVVASNSVHVRARIQGIVEETHFKEGSQVEKGDLLYTIESDSYRATLAQARAQLASTEAEAARTVAFEQRMARLVNSEAISQQDYENAVSAATQAKATVGAAQSVVERAELDLGYTRIVAPESGRIGESLVADGALVGKDGPTHLTTIDRIDPAYVNFTISDLDGMKLRQKMETGLINQSESRGQVVVVLPDGSTFDKSAMVDFTDQLVDPSTGSITIRAITVNPEAALLPGMFVRAKLNVGQRENAILVPQAAVIKAPTGHVAWVVVDGKAERRELVVGEWYGDRWIIEKGIGPGEQVVVEGYQRLVPGREVDAVAVASN